ncbi:MAG: TlyA family RNA methyltransferase [Chloroflexota bacterium]|nr:TlyA family RNA methyltransferase [Chloroflexota bacterium]
MTRTRLDTLMVQLGLVENREKAKARVMAGEVIVNGTMVTKSGHLIREDSDIRVLGSPPFVSRGGLKLDHALNDFQMDVSSKVAMDVGASTGGFTDCLIKRGASKVYAVDVGYGQLDYRLRINPQVEVLERTNARYPIPIDQQVDLITIDVSFISARKIIPSVSELLGESGELIVLLKPQFEVGKGQVGKRGVVRDPLLHATVLGQFLAWSINHGFRLGGLTASPILGTEGNKEFLVLLRSSGSS